MTASATPVWPFPGPVVEGWTVPIPMPVFADGRKQGQPVGWLASNKLPKKVSDWILWNKAITCWRIAGRDALRRHRVPKDLNRVMISWLVRYPAGTSKRYRFDPGNLDLTIKPIQDSLQPETITFVRSKKGGKQARVHYGWGVIPNDTGAHLLRAGQLPDGPDLEPGSPYGGMIILNVYPSSNLVTT